MKRYVYSIKCVLRNAFMSHSNKCGTVRTDQYKHSETDASYSTSASKVSSNSSK